MKKIAFVLTGLITGVCLIAQTSLSFEQHALMAEQDNPMTYCEFLSPGNGGDNQVWDFTSLKAVKEFTGKIYKTSGSDFNTSNTVLEEFGVKFYFDVTEKGIEQYGYQSESGKSQIVYSLPFEKIRFPFNYKDAYTSAFAADYLNDNIITGQLDGSAAILADAWGTLKLPGDTEYKNTLRVKSEKEYTLTFENSAQDVKMITYRWYNSTHRYPLLVLTEITTSINGNNIRTKTQAAYNSNAVQLASSISSIELTSVAIYPNPASEQLILNFESENISTFSVRINDIEGRELFTQNYSAHVGLNELSLNDAINDFPEGIYFLSLNNQGIDQHIEFSIKR